MGVLDGVNQLQSVRERSYQRWSEPEHSAQGTGTLEREGPGRGEHREGHFVRARPTGPDPVPIPARTHLPAGSGGREPRLDEKGSMEVAAAGHAAGGEAADSESRSRVIAMRNTGCTAHGGSAR